MKSYLFMLAGLLMCVFSIKATDVVTTSPAPLQYDSKDVVIFFHADEGNKELANLPSTTEIYAHTGVITNESTGDGDWKYGPTKWGDNAPKYKLEYVSENLWKLNIGSIQEYYGVPDGVTVEKLAFVFRTADCKKEGKGDNNSDIFVTLVGEGFNITMTDNMTGQVISSSKPSVTFTVNSTQAANLSLSINGNVVGSVASNTTLTCTYNFPAEGNYTVEAKGELNGEVRTVSKLVCYAPASTARNYPGEIRQGAVRNADGTVTFCLAAPKKKTAMLIGSWDDFDPKVASVMYYQDVDDIRYFWQTVSGLDPDTVYTYYYYVDNYYKVGDPYAKLVLDPYNDKWISDEVYPDMPQIPEKVGKVMLAVYHENINKYDWQVTDFKGVNKDDLIIYELLIRDFTGTEGQAYGDGTIRGAMAKIPYIKALGANAIELLPITEFDGNLSWGYNPNFYFAPDKAYGTPDDYKQFIDECHRNGIAVIIDMVFNQSSGLHPWYVLYGNAANSPFYNRTAPHAYSVLNDWNQGYPLVDQQWYDCVKYWLDEYKVDGFRFDLVKGLGDNDSYANTSDAATNAYNASRIARMKRIHDAMREVNPDAYFINEDLAGAQEENELATDGELNWANVNNNSCQYAMGYSSSSILTRFNAVKDGRTWGSTVSYAESHDEERMGYKQITWGVADVKASNAVRKARIACVGAQMILQPGAHMIWQFSELGDEQTTKNSSGNDTSNKIVEWNKLQDPDVKGCYDSWCDFGYLRNTYADLFAQDATFNAALTGWNNGRTITASKGDREIVVVLNPNTDPASTLTVQNVGFLLSDNSAYKLASKTYNTDPTFDAAAKTVTLPANSYAIYVRSNMSGIEEVAPTGDVKVYVQNGDIVISGEYTSAQAYTLSGARAPMTGLNAGIYIVNVDGKAFKLIIK